MYLFTLIITIFIRPSTCDLQPATCRLHPPQLYQTYLYFSVVQSKQLSTNDSAVFDLDVVAIKCAER